MHPPTEQERAEYWHERHREQRGPEHRTRLGESERVKQLPFWPGERKDREKARRMIAIEKKIGRPTSFVDSSTPTTTARRSRGQRGSVRGSGMRFR